MGQSQPNYMMDQGSFYRQIANPTPGAGNLIAYTSDGGEAVVKTTVNAASVAAGQVNPVLAQWSAWFARLLPNREIVILDLCEGGTGRGQLMNDADTGRNWSDFAAVVAAARADYDDIDLIVECWMANDVATAQTMGPEWTPLYIGQRWGGGSFTLGNTNPDSVQNPTAVVDHCFWDIEAPADQLGRGIFRRDRTKWAIVGWPTFNSRDNADPEMTNFTDAAGYPTQVDLGARDSLSAMFEDSRFQTFAAYDGFSSHIARMTEGGTAANTHPSVLSEQGQLRMSIPYAQAILREAGYTLEEPQITGVRGPANGSYLDLIVSRPNGGTLSTPSIIKGNKGDPTKDEVEALRFDPALTGCRLPTSELKVLGVDTLPGDMTWTPSTRTLSLAASDETPDLVGWNLDDVYFDLRGTIIGDFADCRFSTRTTQTTFTGIDIFTTAQIGSMRHLTIEGQGYFNRGITQLVNERFERDGTGGWLAPTIGVRERNLMQKFPQDAWKLSAGGVFRFSYFDVQAAFKSAPAAWNSGTTYTSLDPVLFNSRQYVSLTASNTGNSPSGTSADTANWAHYDPHSDYLNPRAVIGSELEILGNYFNMAHDQRRISDAGEPWGMNEGVRMSRNASLASLGDAQQRSISMHKNIISTMGPDPLLEGRQVSYPVSTFTDYSLDDSLVEVHTVENNWITLGAGSPARITREPDPSPNIVQNNPVYDRTTAVEEASPHKQMVTGVELGRNGASRRPVYRESQTGYPADYRGKVVIIDDGVRIIPENPIAFADTADYLRGDSGAILLEDRDTIADLWGNMLIEHVPALYSAADSFAMDGVPVRPQPATLTSLVPAPAFTARGATFDGLAGATGSRLESTSLVTPDASDQGLLSVLFRNTEATWEQLRQFVELRTGVTDVFNLRTATSGRIRIDLGASAVNFYAATGNTQFQLNQWYHLLVAWDDTSLEIYANDQPAYSGTITAAAMDGSSINRASFGGRIGGGNYLDGDLAHFYLNLTETLDITQASNRALFVNSGSPVNLGADGSTPTGTAPFFYLDGDAPAWGNQGSGGTLPVIGTLTASGVPSY